MLGFLGTVFPLIKSFELKKVWKVPNILLFLRSGGYLFLKFGNLLNKGFSPKSFLNEFPPSSRLFESFNMFEIFSWSSLIEFF